MTVRNIANGVTSNGITYLYTEPMVITGFSNNTQPLNGPFSPMTIFGRGFQAPIAVSLAGWGALIQSVSATEIVVVPGPAIPDACEDISGDISITNLNTGSSTSGGSFTYVISRPIITGVSPNLGGPGTLVTISGLNLPSLVDAEVKFGSQTALVSSASSTGDHRDRSDLDPRGAPACTGGNPASTLQNVGAVDVTVTDRGTTCTFTASGIFKQQLPCVLPPTPTVP